MTATIEVLQVQSELDQMVALYRARAPRRVLEIGCWQGGTLREWMAGEPDLLAAVDLEHPNADAYPGWLREGTDFRLHTGSSWEQPAKDFIAQNALYDWAFIDADHGDIGVRSDVQSVLPYMAAGGVLVLHDICAGSDFDGPYPPLAVLREFAADGFETWQFVDDEPSLCAHGIGVIQL